MNVVLTAYLTSPVDPQRRHHWANDPSALRPLLATTPAIVFTDSLELPEGVRVAPSTNPYFDRWTHYAAFLREHTEVEFAFCVDATDVLMLNDPFPHMEPGKLYSGSEPKRLACDWMIYHHQPLARWLKANRDLPLLNCGLLGGDRETVILISEQILAERGGAVMDMGPFNHAAYTGGYDIVTGPLVHTLYKAEETESDAWWKHK